MKRNSYIFTLLTVFGLLFAVCGTDSVKIDGFPLQKQNFSSKQELTAAVYEEILFRFFTRAGVPPNEKDTAAFLEKLNRDLPQKMQKRSAAEIRLLAKQRSNQLSTAARKFFSARIPELEMVEPEELQKKYQQELKRFTPPANLQCSAMMFTDRSTAEKARAALLQGNDFEFVSKTYKALSPQGSGSEFLPLLKAAHPHLSSMMISNVLCGKKHFFVVLVRHFSPGEVISPEEAEACLKEEIIAGRTAELLAILLKSELPKHKIEIPEKIEYKVQQ